MVRINSTPPFPFPSPWSLPQVVNMNRRALAHTYLHLHFAEDIRTKHMHSALPSLWSRRRSAAVNIRLKALRKGSFQSGMFTAPNYLVHLWPPLQTVFLHSWTPALTFFYIPLFLSSAFTTVQASGEDWKPYGKCPSGQYNALAATEDDMYSKKKRQIPEFREHCWLPSCVFLENHRGEVSMTSFLLCHLCVGILMLRTAFNDNAKIDTTAGKQPSILPRKWFMIYCLSLDCFKTLPRQDSSCVLAVPDILAWCDTLSLHQWH